jgi:cytochrome c biogenesis protein CcmG/thiol:disulfide interchange protein DsbE
LTTRPRPAPTGPAAAAAASRPNLLLIGAIAVVILAALAALVVTLVRDEETPEADFDTAVSTVEGPALELFPDTGGDPAVGEQAPTVSGPGRDGTTLVAPADGRPTVLLFLAHWCPHCQAEVPVVGDWVEAGNLPESVDLVGVATATSENRPNYPPSSWLDRENWPVSTIADASGVAAQAYGLSAFPFWVAIDANGTVVERRTGELTPAQLSELVALAR